MLFRLLLILSLSFSLTAAAATYYVSPAGSDRNRGTLAAPFATITKGASVLKPGDQLQVRGGTYRESVFIHGKRSKTSAPIVIRAYPNEKPIIDGKGTQGNGVVAIALSTAIRLEGFEIRNGPNSGIFLYDVQNIHIRKNHVHHNGRYGIRVATDNDSKRGTTRYVLVENNDVHHNVLTNAARKAKSSWPQAIGTWRTSNVHIINNRVHENHGEGIDAVVSENGTIVGNTVWDNFSGNIYLDNATNMKVDRNLVISGRSKEARTFYRDGLPAPSIYAANERYEERDNKLNRIRITNNVTVGGKYGFGYGNFELGGGLRNTVVMNNTFYGAAVWPLFIANDAHESTVFDRNIFVARGGGAYAFAENRNLRFRSNCWHGGKPTTRKKGPGDVVADPRFTRPGGMQKADYRLRPKSPCAGKGAGF